MASLLFAFTILLSAFLLFAVQPLIARFILPWFGGAAAVWTTCLLFFQALLLAGYAYAHLLADRFSPRKATVVHIIMLAACLAALPIALPARLAPTGDEYPTFRILLVLTTAVGLPYFALSATSPLVQHWFAGVYPKRSVYRLYALSNVGSLGALISYPFLIEPALTRRAQSVGWSSLFALFAIASIGCAVVAARRGSGGSVAKTTSDTGPSLTGRASMLVLALTALASALLLATTNKICQDIAPFPFLWVLPLTLYLIAFILCFEYPRAYHRGIILPLAAVAALAAGYVIGWRWTVSLIWQVVVFSIVLLLICVFCLGEAVRLRPAARHLTRYYLLVSLGGVIGAVLVTLVAPLIFTQFLELHISILAAWLFALAILLTDRTSPMRDFRRPVLWIGPILGLPCLALMLYFDVSLDAVYRIQASRSFYGVMEVTEDKGVDAKQVHREFLHNGTTHGVQFMHEEFRRKPTSYYDEQSGVGLTMRKFRTDRSRRVGLVGLGAGTLAAYGKAGDRFTFYELDPEVVDVAKKQFTFLADSPADVQMVLGDARLSLARQENQEFDVLVLDAFSGDAVPVHLLTVEAFAVYRRHLTPGGVIAVHTTNRHLQLVLPAYAVARHHGLLAEIFHRSPAQTPYPSEWILMTDDRAFLDSLRAQPSLVKVNVPPMAPWTDDHAPLFPILRGIR